MTTQAQTCSLVIEKDMPHPPEKVWRALTQPALLEQWLMKNDFQPVVGHRFSFRAAPAPNWNGLVECEVLALEAPSLLSYSWSSMGVGSVVSWTLAPTQSGTHLRFEQTGFRSKDDPGYKGASYGWQKFTGGLEKVVGALG
jgi:uncharacterized protein YndB with AHSA1/START domain